jgi:hypothetical protein
MVFNTATDSETGTPNVNVPGVVLAVSPDNRQVLINDQLRRVFYLYNTAGSVAATFTGVGNAAMWTPDAKTLYVTDSASLGPNHSDTLYVYNANAGWTTYSLTSSGGATNLALTIPSVGAYLAGPTTVAHTWCPSGTASNYASISFYPEGDRLTGVPNDVLASTVDGQHILGAAITGGAVELSDIGVSIPFTPASGTATGGSTQVVNLPNACPQTGSQLEPLLLTHTLNQTGVSGINATALNQIVASPVSNLAFLTYNSTGTGGKLPYYVPGARGTLGALNYIALNGGNAVIAPIAGAFSLDNQFFFVSTAGDDLIHFVKTSTLQDTQQISPGLPACTAGTDPDCVYNTVAPPASGVVPASVIVVKPRPTV